MAVSPPPGLRNKGRYVLLALLAAGVWACRPTSPAPQSTARGAPAALVASAGPSAPPPAPDPNRQGCLGDAPTVTAAPPPPQPLSGELGLWVAEVDPATLRPLRAVAQNPDRVFPLASTYKQAVLWAVLRQFDAGTLSPNERFKITRENQSLGAYPFDNTSLKDLSVRMIRNSDNTATDILHRRVGLKAVQNVADELGLCRTRLILPTKDWWAAQAGLSDTLKGTHRWDTATGEERVKLAEAIDADAQRYRPDYVQRRLDAYFDADAKPEDDLHVHNLSTPYEFAALLAHEYLRPRLSPQALRWQREVAAMGFGRSALRATAADNVTLFGGKGGNGWRILTYTGYFKTKDGRNVVYAFMQHGADQTYTMPNTRRAFAWINAAVDEVLGQQVPKPHPLEEKDEKAAAGKARP
ncbi:serine hydrolase [Deinococcus hopiensis]|uniref:Beta-lactamase class A n=1 Tax=Deinococcus hopiensis KR-140 TaxID=695939 RepID=A0A1W1VEV9_9DEIO|nr:serine hydrolase [Deinococcus hopiensis]SMB91939.1 Beta-lactamase class A [Deinococcus hopiensis KR-140]